MIWCVPGRATSKQAAHGSVHAVGQGHSAAGWYPRHSQTFILPPQPVQLVRLTHKSLEDLTKLTPLVPVDDGVYPQAETKKDREKVQTLSVEEFERRKLDLVHEFVQRAKEVEVLIDVMPSPQDASTIASPSSLFHSPGTSIRGA
ncbi:hypothetical protein QFC19_001447 [Naganishia cerealis]|uniref:Uncharacterized protein n=1 Tax=Naganishia cerealis TaxID=610337 RepID=A0ACC2WFU6_9TREE|nr:hypothetical protein QFC19_001447 [Naganishia cerealis]